MFVGNGRFEIVGVLVELRWRLVCLISLLYRIMEKLRRVGMYRITLNDCPIHCNCMYINAACMLPESRVGYWTW